MAEQHFIIMADASGSLEDVGFAIVTYMGYDGKGITETTVPTIIRKDVKCRSYDNKLAAQITFYKAEMWLPYIMLDRFDYQTRTRC